MFKALFLILCIFSTACSQEECNPDKEFYQDCSNIDKVRCEITCDNFRLPLHKNQCVCEPKCVCKKRYVKNTEEGRCVYRFECPNTWWPWNGISTN